MTNTFKNLLKGSLLIIVLGFLSACDKGSDNNDPKPSGAVVDILVTHPWKLVNVTELNGNDVPENKLDVMTKYLYELNFAFAANNTVKAMDTRSSQVANGGTWYLKDDNKVLDIDVSGFKGKFNVKDLKTTRMALLNNIKINGVEQEGILIFEPVIK